MKGNCRNKTMWDQHSDLMGTALAQISGGQVNRLLVETDLYNTKN